MDKAAMATMGMHGFQQRVHHSKGSGTSLFMSCCFCTQCAYGKLKCEDDIPETDIY